MAVRKHRPKPSKERNIALDRIEKLFEQAEISFKDDLKLSDRYVGLALKIAMKFKVSIRSELKRRFCKHCHAYLKQGVNCRVRLHDGKLIYQCSACKGYMRFPYRERFKSKRSRIN
jgi:ribonuclease P protein subunit RPR2